MDKIAVFAMSENGGDAVTNYMANSAKDRYQILDFSSDEIEDMVKQTKEEASDVIVIFDALEGMNRPFAHAVAKLHEAHIKPILVILNAEEVSDTSEAEMSIAEIVAQNDRTVQPWDLNYRTLFFSETKGFSKTPAFERGGIDALLEKIK